jgi:hypothetical protein
MDRSEFIKEIMSLYPHTFDPNNELQYSGWIKRYQQIPKNWDFDKLMSIFAKKWSSTREAPAPSWFMQFAEDVRPATKPVYEERVEMSEEECKRTDELIKNFGRQLYKIAESHKL